MKVKRLAAFAAVALLAAVLTGCLQITGHSGQQQDVVGPVSLSLNLCTGAQGSSSTNPTCGNGNDGNEQLLVAYQVPTTVQAPAAARFTGPDGTLALAPDADYASYNEQIDPSPAGRHWVAYRSPTTNFTGSPPTRKDYIAASDFTLTPQSDGSPFQGPVQYKIRYGERYPVTGNDAGPTVCPPATTTPAMRARVRRAYLRGGRAAARRAVARQGAGAPNPDSNCDRGTATDSVTTNDLAVLPGGAATAQPGSTVDIPFNLKFAGPASDAASFDLTVAGVPGATVQTPFKPAADSTTAVPVTVALPDDLDAGDYTVTLTATKGAQTRTGSAQLTVNALPPLTETLDELPQTTLSQVQSSGQPATVGCNIKCTATVDLLLYKPPADRAGISAAARYRAVPTVLLGRVKTVLAAGATQAVTVPVRDNAKDKLGNLGKFTLVVRTTATGPRGQVTPALVRKVRLAPGCGGRSNCVPRR